MACTPRWTFTVPSARHATAAFIAIHAQLAVLKELLLRCGPNLWQNFCKSTEPRLQENPVMVLNYIRALNAEALQLTVSQKGSVVRQELQPYPAEPAPDGIVVTTMDMATLQRKARGYDTVAEINRVAYEQSRLRGVWEDAMRWCRAAGVTEEDVQLRHDRNECYYCGTAVRKDGIIVHTFWQCPQRQDKDEAVTRQLRLEDQEKGAGSQRISTQKRDNDRRQESTFRETNRDQSFARRPPRVGNGTNRWGSRDPSQERYSGGRDPPDSPHPVRRTTAEDDYGNAGRDYNEPSRRSNWGDPTPRPNRRVAYGPPLSEPSMPRDVPEQGPGPPRRNDPPRATQGDRGFSEEQPPARYSRDPAMNRSREDWTPRSRSREPPVEGPDGQANQSPGGQLAPHNRGGADPQATGPIPGRGQ